MALTDEGPAAHDTTTRAAGLRRYRRLGFLTVLLALLGVVTVLTSGVYPIRLLRTDVHCGRTASGDVNGQLQCLVSEYTGQDPSVHNIELAVAKVGTCTQIIWFGACPALPSHPISSPHDVPRGHPGNERKVPLRLDPCAYWQSTPACAGLLAGGVPEQPNRE